MGDMQDLEGKPLEMEADGASQGSGGDDNTLSCPVCPAEKIPGESEKCPSCGTDLRPLHRARELPRLHYNEALALAQAGALDSAMMRLSAALALDETFWQARRFLGKLLWETGAEKEAFRQWRLAARLAPEDEELAGLLNRAEKTEEEQAPSVFPRKAGFLAAWLLSTVAAAGIAIMVLGLRGGAREVVEPAGDAEAYASELAAIRGDMEAVEDGMERLTAAVEALGAGNDAGDAEAGRGVEELAAKLASVETAVGTVTSALADIQADAEEQGEPLAEVVARAEAFEAQLKAQVEELSEAQSEALAELERQVAAAVEEAADVREQMEQSERDTASSIEALAQMLRPPDAKEVAEEIERLRGEVERLEEVEREARDRNRFVIDSVRAFDVANRRRMAERELRELEAKYERMMAQWRAAMARLGLPAQGDGVKVQGAGGREEKE